MNKLSINSKNKLMFQTTIDNYVKLKRHLFTKQHLKCSILIWGSTHIYVLNSLAILFYWVGRDLPKVLPSLYHSALRKTRIGPSIAPLRYMYTPVYRQKRGHVTISLITRCCVLNKKLIIQLSSSTPYSFDWNATMVKTFKTKTLKKP